MNGKNDEGKNMPESPFRRAAREGLNDNPDGSSGSGKKKGKSRPTTARRNRRQKTKERYSKAREDAQLEGIIPTTPEGAVRTEPVSPSVQGNQPLPNLIADAIRKGWAVPEGIKPGLVDEMVQIIMDPEMPAKAKVGAFNALRMADQAQYERDNPEAASKSKGNVPSVSVNMNIQAATVIRELVERGEIGEIGDLENDKFPGARPLEEISPPAITGAPSNGRHAGTVETSTAPTDNQQ